MNIPGASICIRTYMSVPGKAYLISKTSEKLENGAQTVHA